MKAFFQKIWIWIVAHKVISIAVASVLVVGITLSVVLPIALDGKNNNVLSETPVITPGDETGGDETPAAEAKTYTVNFYIDSALYASDKVEESKTVAEPKEPQQEHKTFDKWYTDDACTVPFDFSASIRGNTDLYGKFDVEQVTVNFYEVVDGHYYKINSMTCTVDYNTALTEPTAPAKEHYTFVQWYGNHELTSAYDFSKPVTREITLYGKYVKHGTYTMENGTVYGWEQLIANGNVKVIGTTLSSTNFNTLAGGTLVVNDSIERVNAGAFRNAKVKAVILPDSVTEILQEAFKGSTLEIITLPDTLESIGNEAFADTQLKELIIPPSVTSIGSKILDGQAENKTLTKLTAPLIGGFTYNCFGSFFGADEYAKNAEKVPTSLKEVVLTQAKDDRIPERAFSECRNIEKITVKGTIKEIDRYAFENCVGLQEIVLEEGIEKIYRYILNGCSSLTTLDIPESLTYLDSIPFAGIANLEVVAVKPTSALFDRDYGFLQLFGADDITTENGVEYLKKSIKKVIVKDSATEITDEFFYYRGKTAAHFAIEEIVIGKNVKTIGESAFESCGYMTKVNLPEGLTTIGSEAFMRCKSLEQIDLPSTLTTIGYAAFAQCYALKSITIPASVTSFGNGVFLSCSALKTATFLAENIETIGSKCFSDCGSLTSVTLPKKLKTIGYDAFGGCDNLTEIHLPSSVTMIYSGAFSCIGVVDGAYAKIYPMEKIYFEGTKEQWNKIEIYRVTGADTYEILPISRISDDVGDCTVYCSDGTVKID